MSRILGLGQGKSQSRFRRPESFLQLRIGALSGKDEIQRKNGSVFRWWSSPRGLCKNAPLHIDSRRAKNRCRTLLPLFVA